MSATVGLHSENSAWRFDLDRAMRRARRHSLLVRVLRVALPVGLVGAVALYTLFVYINPLGRLAGLSVANLAISGTRVTMSAPRLTGFSSDGRSYELTAGAAAQDLKRPHIVELKAVRAVIQMRDNTTANVTADAGFYDTRAERMTLRDHVLLSTTAGTEVRLSEAVIEVRKGQMASDKPVEVLLQGMRIRGDAMQVDNNASAIIFRGRVSVHVEAERTKHTNAAAAETSRQPEETRVEN